MKGEIVGVLVYTKCPSCGGKGGPPLDGSCDGSGRIPALVTLEALANAIKRLPIYVDENGREENPDA